MEPAIYQSSIGAVWADALFVSALQRCDRPSAGQVKQAVAAAVGVFGPLGCAERVAQEFGDHPEAAVTRMRWARTLAAKAMGDRERALPAPDHRSRGCWPAGGRQKSLDHGVHLLGDFELDEAASADRDLRGLP